MAIGSIAPAGAVGLIKDIPPAELPNEAWSDCINMRFTDGVAQSYMGPVELLSSTPVNFSSAQAGPTTLTGFASWVLGSAASLYGYAANTLTNITRVGGPYTGSSTNRWSGGVLGGVTVMNNGVDIPQVWLVPDLATKVVDLPHWQSEVRAGCIRVYKQFLIALDITKSGLNFPTLVKWSHPADPGTVPITWDEADETKDAGEYPLSETSGRCLDAVPLRDTMLIYKQDSVWAMQYIGGTFIFKFTKIFGDFGVQGRDCAVEYQSGRHFVFTGSDLIIHDGQTATSVASGKIRKLLRAFSAPQLQSAFVVLNAAAQEVWLCYRQATDGILAVDTAIAFNWTTGTISLFKLGQYGFVASGRVDPPVTGVVTWESVSGGWSGASGEWGESVILPARMRMLALGTGKLDWLEAQPYSKDACFLERTYLGVQFRAAKAPDMATMKFIRRIWPRITGSAGSVLFIELGSADDVSDPIVWESPFQYIVGEDTYIDPILSGKLFGVRISSLDTAQWTYAGMDVDVTPAGEL